MKEELIPFDENEILQVGKYYNVPCAFVTAPWENI